MIHDLLIAQYPFQVRKWLPEEPALKFLGQAHWMEECRCQTKTRAETIARALHVVGYGILAVVKFHEQVEEGTAPSIEYVAWYPDRETVEREMRLSGNEPRRGATRWREE